MRLKGSSFNFPCYSRNLTEIIPKQSEERNRRANEFSFGVGVELRVEFLRIEFMRYFEGGSLSTKPEET